MERAKVNLKLVSVFCILFSSCFQSERPSDYEPPQPPSKDQGVVAAVLSDATSDFRESGENTKPYSRASDISEPDTEDTEQRESSLADAIAQENRGSLSDLDVKTDEGEANTSASSPDSVVITEVPSDTAQQEVIPEDVSEACPTCEGSNFPQWSLLDFQPASTRFGDSYGLEAFKGRVIVLALLAGW